MIDTATAAPPQLTATDLCMCGCTARALVRIQVPVDGTEDLIVDYCGHHFTGHESGLDQHGVAILVDIRDQDSTTVDTSTRSPF